MLVGTTQRILVEGPSRKSAFELMGRTECNRIVNFDGGPQAQRLVGQMLDVHISLAYPHSLRGELMLVDDRVSSNVSVDQAQSRATTA